MGRRRCRAGEHERDGGDQARDDEQQDPDPVHVGDSLAREPCTAMAGQQRLTATTSSPTKVRPLHTHWSSGRPAGFLRTVSEAGHRGLHVRADVRRGRPPTNSRPHVPDVTLERYPRVLDTAQRTHQRGPVVTKVRGFARAHPFVLVGSILLLIGALSTAWVVSSIYRVESSVVYFGVPDAPQLSAGPGQTLYRVNASALDGHLRGR